VSDADKLQNFIGTVEAIEKVSDKVVTVKVRRVNGKDQPMPHVIQLQLSKGEVERLGIRYGTDISVQVQT